MSTNLHHTDVLIVGAGIAGLMAAHALRERGLRVTLLDKGRSVGGRLATRRIGDGKADHGAQFFTVRTPEFQKWVSRWLAADLIYQWSNGWSTGSFLPTPVDGYPRYAVFGGMNALAKHLAEGFEVFVNVQVTRVTPTDNGWQVQVEGGRVYVSKGLVLTPPVPQTLALLDTSILTEDDRTALERLDYAPCLCGLFVVHGPVYLPDPGAIQRPDETIPWIADNQRKGISLDETVVTVHAGPDYSRQLWDIPDLDVLQMLQAALVPFLRSMADVGEAQLKRWRYVLPTDFYPRRTLIADGLPPLAFAGDAFGEPRVEGAAMSGQTAGERLAEKLLAG
jgi:predicted NAD/FAD-dependent oxidoreductase